MTVNGYEIIGELKSDNSGFSKWGFALKDGVEVFIKEFLSPVYPLNEGELSIEQIQRKKKICNEFEAEKRSFYNELNKCVTGNIVTIGDFFRSGSHYYIVTNKVDTNTIDIETISSFNYEQKLLIIRIILYCMQNLHQHGIVHGDIKPDNILLKKTLRGSYTAKIIDFDSSFLESNPPVNGEELQGDLVYLSPEGYLLMAESEEDVIIGRKIDVFALGILFHQYLSGELPKIDNSKYEYIFESVLDGCKPAISSKIPDEWGNIICAMLDLSPDQRPELQQIFDMLSVKPGQPHSESAEAIKGQTVEK